MEQFPSATTLNDATCQSLLSGCTQQTPIEVAEVAFSIIVGTRQTGHVVAVEQAGGVADSGLLDGLGQVTLMINRPHLRFADARACLQVSLDFAKSLSLCTTLRTLGKCDYFTHGLHGLPSTGVRGRQLLTTLRTLLQFTLIYDSLFRVQFSLGSHGSLLRRGRSNLP